MRRVIHQAQVLKSRWTDDALSHATQEPEHVKEYWYDPRIHNFGNIGLAGRFHALMAPFATVKKSPHPRRFWSYIELGCTFLTSSLHLCRLCSQALIDHRAYDGVDIRKRVHSGFPDKASVLDLCCGTGFSTARGAIGVDTSNEMLDMVSSACRRHSDAAWPSSPPVLISTPLFFTSCHPSPASCFGSLGLGSLSPPRCQIHQGQCGVVW